nr:MAG TPA: hypothetical protein [Caudoviricetes sp.]
MTYGVAKGKKNIVRKSSLDLQQTYTIAGVRD